jgi:hypothetical protein
LSAILPSSDFAEAFRAHSVPRIRTVIEVRAYFVGLGLYPFASAHADVMCYASKLGATFLPPEHLEALIDWPLAQLCEAAAAVDRHNAEGCACEEAAEEMCRG